MNAPIAELFTQAGCTGQLCVQSLDGTQEIAVDADRPVVSASVFKVSVALEAETQFTDGRLDRQQRVILPAAARTPPHAAAESDQVDSRVRHADAVRMLDQDRPAPAG